MTSPAAVLEITGLSKSYAALRPLRVESLAVAPRERVALGGLDAAGAELFVNLVTGAALPEEGEVRVFGQPTSAIANGDDWLASLDRFGIVSHRAVLLEGAPLAQNLALSFSLTIDPMPEEVHARVVALAGESGIGSDLLDRIAGEASAAIRARVHVARAIAADPALLLLEHPTAWIPEEDRPAFARDVVRVCEARSLTAVAVTSDREFSAIFAHRTLTLQGATGTLVTNPEKRWW
jgi:ABC-type lipoprotein export system ATPase subunit